MNKQSLQILLANPRGFCAGVDRAIQTVEKALEIYGAPVYVRHEIVHNKHVVDNLRQQGAVFVDDLDKVPEGRPVIFSAHGVPKSVPETARVRQMIYVDATCPLVSKVHREAEIHYEAGHQILLIGHAGHPEVIGTMGQLPTGAIQLIETVADAQAVDVGDPKALAYVTQTTLSVDETAEIVEVLKQRFPDIAGPRNEDICYATTNRQAAVKNMAAQCDAMLVLGSGNSSNSRRLVEVALRHGCPKARLIQDASEIDWQWLQGVQKLGLTAGASAPENLVQGVIDACQQQYEVVVQTVSIKEENVVFKLPKMTGPAYGSVHSH